MTDPQLNLLRSLLSFFFLLLLLTTRGLNTCRPMVYPKWRGPKFGVYKISTDESSISKVEPPSGLFLEVPFEPPLVFVDVPQVWQLIYGPGRMSLFLPWSTNLKHVISHWITIALHLSICTMSSFMIVWLWMNNRLHVPNWGHYP